MMKHLDSFCIWVIQLEAIEKCKSICFVMLGYPLLHELGTKRYDLFFVIAHVSLGFSLIVICVEYVFQ